MSKTLCWILLSVLLIIPAVISYKRSRDIFSPICFFNFYTFISTIPRLLFMEYNLYTMTLTTETVRRYFIVTALNILIVNGVFLCLSNNIHLLMSKNDLNESKEEKESISVAFIYFLFAIGAFSKLYLLYKVGGILEIWSNINSRTKLLAGNNYINNLEIFLLISTALIFCKYLDSNKKKYLPSLLIIAITSSILLLSFGGRAGFVRMIIVLLFVINYKNGYLKVKYILKPQMLLLIVLTTLIIVMIPMVRSEEFKDIYATPVLWIQSGIKNIGSIFENISSVDRDMCAYDIFTYTNKWHGRSYLGILTSWIPSSLFPDKPPVDDGVYLANLIDGYNVVPIMAYNRIPLHSSSPFSSMGIMFANFGYVGVVLGSIILGLAYYISYKTMVLHDRSMRYVLIYGYVMTLFGLSVHSILTLLIPYILISIALRQRRYRFVIGRRRL